MLTILSTPKAFTGLFAVIQRNAITSWTRLDPRPEIILFGRDAGTAEICAELGLRHVPDVATSPHGTPLLSDMFLTGQALASNHVVCWANADIIFTPTIMRAAAVVRGHDRAAYLVGRRTDIEQPTPLELDGGWDRTLAARAAVEGEIKPVNWIDYFMFTRGLFTELPPFAIGRPGYDPWLIWKAAELGADVIDATQHVLAVHQRHDYSHVGGRSVAFAGVEAQQNAAIVDDWRHYHSIAYARLKLDASGDLVPATGLMYSLARPRTYAGHLLRFTRPLRRHLLGERATRRRGPRGATRPTPPSVASRPTHEAGAPPTAPVS
ncbi:MAG: hypothetical protein JWM05_2995 [Acidimicrobiales bacterium]|nr:hypothetical protein [Acidimicrobiales bacterium]